ncbi:MAG: hypothetical protein AAF488_02035 [Planctomycetota bacterium]
MHGIEMVALIAIGIYLYLFAAGTVPGNPKDPERLDQLREEHGRTLKVAGVGLMIVGMLFLVRLQLGG